MLVNRYFGSKEQLFAEVVALTMATPDILARENLDAGRHGPAGWRHPGRRDRHRSDPARRLS